MKKKKGIHKFKVFNKIQQHGKPFGRQFLYATISAKNATAAKNSVQRENRQWNKASVNKRQGFKAKVVKVVKVK